MELKEGITWEKARQRETDFFATKEAWRDLDSFHKKYLGVSNLVQRLSNILSDKIQER
jgi:hypothetical protein